MIQVFIALLLFTFFAICGLVADLGLARVAHRDMQAGTTSAALEGVLAGGGAGFETEEVERARHKLRHRLARLADSRLDRAIAHAARAAADRPPLTETERLLDRLARVDVQRAWREHLRAPTLTGVLTP